jgi:hypothetical protein
MSQGEVIRERPLVVKLSSEKKRSFLGEKSKKCSCSNFERVRGY